MSKRTIILIVILVVVWGFAIIYLINYLKPKPVTLSQPQNLQQSTSQTTGQPGVQQSSVNLDEIKKRFEENEQFEKDLKTKFKESLEPYVLILNDELLLTNSLIDDTTDQFYYMGNMNQSGKFKIFISNNGKEESFVDSELYNDRFKLISVKPTYIILFDLVEGNIKKLSYRIQ